MIKVNNEPIIDMTRLLNTKFKDHQEIKNMNFIHARFEHIDFRKWKFSNVNFFKCEFYECDITFNNTGPMSFVINTLADCSISRETI